MDWLKNLYSTETHNANWVSLILRLVGGGLMLLHGTPKFFKILEGDYQFADPIGIGVGPSLFLTVFAEFICALLLIIGLGTRFVSLPLIITMFVAAFIVHGSDPLGDKELALIYLAIFLCTFLLGGGKYSVDNLIRKKL